MTNPSQPVKRSTQDTTLGASPPKQEAPVVSKRKDLDTEDKDTSLKNLQTTVAKLLENFESTFKSLTTNLFEKIGVSFADLEKSIKEIGNIVNKKSGDNEGNKLEGGMSDESKLKVSLEKLEKLFIDLPENVSKSLKELIDHLQQYLGSLKNTQEVKPVEQNRVELPQNPPKAEISPSNIENKGVTTNETVIREPSSTQSLDKVQASVLPNTISIEELTKHLNELNETMKKNNELLKNRVETVGKEVSKDIGIATDNKEDKPEDIVQPVGNKEDIPVVSEVPTVEKVEESSKLTSEKKDVDTKKEDSDKNRGASVSEALMHLIGLGPVSEAFKFYKKKKAEHDEEQDERKKKIARQEEEQANNIRGKNVGGTISEHLGHIQNPPSPNVTGAKHRPRAIPKASEGTTIKEGQMVIVGDRKDGKETGAEEVVVNKGGNIEVISNQDAKEMGFIGDDDFGTERRAGGSIFGAMAAGNQAGAGAQAGHDIAGGISGAVQGVVSTIGAMFGPLGEGIAAVVNSVIGIFEKLAHVLIDVVSGFNKLAEKVGDFSPEITEARVKAMVRELETDINIAETAGPDLAKVYDLSSDIWQSIREILVSIAQPLMEIIIPILQVFKDFLDFIKPIIELMGFALKLFIKIVTGDFRGAVEAVTQRIDRINRNLERDTTNASLSARVLREAIPNFQSVPNIGG